MRSTIYYYEWKESKQGKDWIDMVGSILIVLKNHSPQDKSAFSVSKCFVSFYPNETLSLNQVWWFWFNSVYFTPSYPNLWNCIMRFLHNAAKTFDNLNRMFTPALQLNAYIWIQVVLQQYKKKIVNRLQIAWKKIPCNMTLFKSMSDHLETFFF